MDRQKREDRKQSRPVMSRQDAVSSLLRRFPSSGSRAEKCRTLRILLTGQPGVGKTALAVRFVTKRFIGDYDPTLERIYTLRNEIDGELIVFEVLDTAGQATEEWTTKMEQHIRWADAYIIIYSVTDKCSFDECMRLKFLINHIRKRGPRKLNQLHPTEYPVILVGNKTDQIGDRMVSYEQGRRRSLELGCSSFHEISVRESYEEVKFVFGDLYREWRLEKHNPKVLRSNTDEGRSPTKNRSPTLSPTQSPEEKERNRRESGELIRWISADSTRSNNVRSKDTELLKVTSEDLCQRRNSVSMQGSLSQVYAIR